MRGTAPDSLPCCVHPPFMRSFEVASQGRNPGKNFALKVARQNAEPLMKLLIACKRRNGDGGEGLTDEIKKGERGHRNAVFGMKIEKGNINFVV